MKETRILMGMPIVVEIIGEVGIQEAINKVFEYFIYVDEKFSTYKVASEITRINNGEITPENYSQDMKAVFELSEKTKQETNGYFDIATNNGKIDPSGLVKGWAIFNASKILENLGFEDFYVSAGGDIQVGGLNTEKKPWSVGIRNPFKPNEVVKTVYLKNDEGIATSGSYERGGHIYNPHLRQGFGGQAKDERAELTEIVSLTVIGKNIYEADRFATAAFAMQKEGINFIEKLPGLQGYSIDKNGIATMTTGFEKYTKE